MSRLRPFRPFVLLLLVAVMGGAALLLLWIPRDRQRTLDGWRARLAAIADDRRRTLEVWVGERQADVQALGGFPDLVRLNDHVPRPASPRGLNPDDPVSRTLAGAARAYAYLGLWVVAPDGTVVASLPGGPAPDEGSLEAEHRARATGGATLAFHREGGAVRLVVAGLVEGRPREQALMLIAETDPSPLLYALLREEAVPTRTGEAFLVRREGNRVVFLSPLRNDPTPPLVLERPLDPGAAHSVATAGRAVEGGYRDYRGQSVLAAMRPIRGTDWALVVKVDEAEALGPHRADVIRAAVGLLLLLGALFGVGFLLWRNQQASRLFLELQRREAAEARRSEEQRVLEMVARGASLPQTLEALVLHVEKHAPGLLGSVLLVENGRVRHGAMPHLPAAYARAVDGQEIGPDRGSCGTAAFLGAPVIVGDIATDPRWAAYRDLALASGLRACWSVPIRASDGAVCGTFALYYGEPRVPTPEEMALIERGTHLAAIAIERSRSAEALRRNESELRAIFDGAAMGMALLEKDGTLVRTNPALESFLGYSATELRVMTFVAVTHPEDRERDAAQFTELLAGQRSHYEMEKRYLRKDGEVVWGHLYVSLLPGGADGRPGLVLGMVEDVTETRRLQEEFRQAQKMEAVGRLAGGIAHDFNNLLGVIMGYAQIQLSRLASESDPAWKGLTGILRAAERGARLTKQLLAFSRKQTFELRDLDVNDVVREIARMLPQLLGADVKVELDLGPEPSTVRADPGQLDQILMNLAVNARDAMPEGGTFTIETRVVEVGSLHVRLRVRDSGHGMSPEVVARVFEPFFTTKERDKGTGLGLATVYGIVKQTGGFLNVESAPGQGACFEVYLPCERRAPTSAKQAAAPALSRGSETVLVVDDEPAMRELVSEQLAGCGYRVLSAESAADALRMVGDAGDIDLLLTDVVMPHMNGPELARRVRERRPGLRVLYMSGYADGAGGPQAELAAGGFLLAKPFTGEALAAKVREVLESATMRRYEAHRDLSG